ncbi:MAG: hypothetical protein V3V25_13745 [Paracoccaceae bacterium]
MGFGGILGVTTYAARMEQHVAEGIIERCQEPRAVVASVIGAFPQAYGAEAAFALTAVAAGLESPVLEGQSDYFPQRQELYRCAALLAADICAVEVLTQQRSTCAAIRQYWDKSNEVFFQN